MAPIVREHSAQAEQERRLSQPVLDALRETGLLRMNTPVHSGGWRPTVSLLRALVEGSVGTTLRRRGPWRTL